MLQTLFEALSSRIAISVLIVLASLGVMPFFTKSRFDPKGKYIYITGASTGLGHAVATQLLQKGASIAIVSQNPQRLQQAKEVLEKLAGDGQKVIAVQADLTKSEESDRALIEAIEKGGREIDHAILCAGLSKPRWFVEMTTDDLEHAYSLHALCKRMVSYRLKGKIVVVGSFLGYTSFVGYSAYSAGKYALRGLTDSLRNEMLLHDIDIHYFAPAGIESPGNVAEQEFKPAPTKKLEEGDTLQKPADVAGHLFRGLERGYYAPTTYFITELMRLGSKGGVPGNNPIMDFIYWLGSGIGMPIWVFFMDRIVKGFKRETEAELESKGFYKIKA